MLRGTLYIPALHIAPPVHHHLAEPPDWLQSASHVAAQYVVLRLVYTVTVHDAHVRVQWQSYAHDAVSRERSRRADTYTSRYE